jgi:UDP-glucose 4-epimerase
MPGNRVLVTGAAGFIGSHTVDRLIADGHEVIGIDDLSTGNESNLSGVANEPKFTLERFDVTDADHLTQVVARFRPDAIIHLAALVSVPMGESDPRLNYKLNIQATHEICEAARAHAVKRIVFSSSAAVYGDCADLPLNESSPTDSVSQYGWAKRISEQMLASYGTSFGIQSVCFRYFNVYGPRQDPASPYSGVVSIFSDRYRAGQQVTIFGDGAQSRDFVYVGDVAQANVLAATAPSIPSTSIILNCCTGTSTSLLDLISTLNKIYSGVPAPEHQEDRTGDIKHSLGNPTRIGEIFQLIPGTAFEDGLKALLESTRK